MIKEINNYEFDDLVQKCPKLLLVECYTINSTGSYLLELSLSELLRDLSDVISAYKIDIQKNRSISKKYDLSSYPSLLFINNNKLIEVVRGPTPKNVILNKIVKIMTTTKLD